MNPYYIVAPRYIRTSAGIRVLYRLCNQINKLGYSSFIFLRPHSNFQVSSSISDIAPFLTSETILYHFKEGLTPIVIYPETFNIDSFNAPFKVCYFLNYDNLLNKSLKISNIDYFLAYSTNIAKDIQTTKPLSTIFLPVSDHNFFSPPNINNVRSGSVFYACKYKNKFNGKLLSITSNSIEIKRDTPDSQSPEEIRDLFRQCEFFYCYEDSSLAIEAILCGCPVIFIPNEFFKKPIGSYELLNYGFAWGYSSEQIIHAKNTVVKARERYLTILENANLNIHHFINESQLLVRNISYDVCFASTKLHKYYFFQKIESYFFLIKDTLCDRGFFFLFKQIFSRIRSKRYKIFL